MGQALTGEQQFFADIARILQAGRKQAQQAVNTVMVHTYWQLGKCMLEQEQQGKVLAMGLATLKNLRQAALYKIIQYSKPRFDWHSTGTANTQHGGHQYAKQDFFHAACVSYFR